MAITTPGTVTLGTYRATDATGWTVIQPVMTDSKTVVQQSGTAYTDAAGTRFVYVSSSYDGSNGTGIGTELRPYTTIALGWAQIRVGSPDWLLLKCGDTFRTTGAGVISNTTKGGVSESAPLVITSYGTGDRPSVQPAIPVSGSVTAFSMKCPGGYYAIMGIDFYSYQRDVTAGTFDPTYANLIRSSSGIGTTGAQTNYLLVEDCRFRWGSVGVTSDHGQQSPKNGKLYIRRNVFHNNYAGDNGAMGDDPRGQPVFVSNYWATDSEVLIEENIYYYCGWNADVYLADKALYPSISVTGAVNNGSGLIRLTVTSTSTLTTGDIRYVQNVGGINTLSVPPNAVVKIGTGSWTLTKVDATHVDLQGSTFTTGYVYTSGGEIAERNLANRHDENHSNYVSGGSSAGAHPSVAPTMRGNLSIKPAANFLRDSCGGFLTENLHMGSPNIGYTSFTNYTTNPTPPPYDWTDNICLHMCSIRFPVTPYKWFVQTTTNGKGNGPFLQGNVDGTTVRSNIYAHYDEAATTNNQNPRAVTILDSNNCVVTNNIVYKLTTNTPIEVTGTSTGTTGISPQTNLIDLNGVNGQGWPHPERTMITYCADELGLSTPTSFDNAMDVFGVLACDNLSKQNWDADYTPATLWSYFREGFGLEGTTPPTADPPTVTTDAIATLTYQSVTLNGTVTNSGGANITERGFAYGTSSNPTIAGTHTAVSGTTGGYSYALASLSASTTYHVRAYATNSEGTSYGTDVSFGTPAAPGAAPSATTNNPSLIAKHRVVLSGNITSEGTQSVTERGFVSNATGAPTINDTKYVVAGTTGAYTYEILNTTPGATYFVRAYATSSVGTGYGADVSFTVKSTYKTNLRLIVRDT